LQQWSCHLFAANKLREWTRENLQKIENCRLFVWNEWNKKDTKQDTFWGGKRSVGWEEVWGGAAAIHSQIGDIW
jgi:hypothetical protein